MRKKIIQAVNLFSIFLFFSTIAFLVAENPLNLSNYFCQLSLYASLCIIYATIVLLDGLEQSRKNTGSYLDSLKIIPFLLAYISTAILIQETGFIFYRWNFWICFFLWILAFIVMSNSLNKTSETKIFEKVILFVFSVWAILNLYIELGRVIGYSNQSIPLLGYAVTLVIIRGGIIGLIGIAIVINSIITVLFKREYVEIPDRYSTKVQSSSGVFGTIIYVFKRFLIYLSNNAYKLFMVIYQISREVIEHIIQTSVSLIKQSGSVLIFYGIIILVVIIFYLTNKASDEMLSYLRVNDIIPSLIGFISLILWAIPILISFLFLNHLISVSHNSSLGFIEGFTADHKEIKRRLTKIQEFYIVNIFFCLVFASSTLWISSAVIFKNMHNFKFSVLCILTLILGLIVAIDLFIKRKSKVSKEVTNNL